MYINQLGIITLLAVFAILAVVIVYLFVAYERSRRRHVKPQNTDETAVIEHAHSRAQGIIDRAVEKSEETLLQTEFLKQELVRHGEESITEVVENIVKLLNQDGVKYDEQYQQLFDTIRAQYVEKTNEALSVMQKAADTELAAFRAAVKQGTIGTQTQLDLQMKEEFAAAKKDLENYKVARMAKINQEINALCSQVMLEVLGRSIPLAEHEKLLMEALEEAKKEGIFAGTE